MIPVDDIRMALESRFTDARVEVQDLTGTGDHFEALVVTSDFEGLSRVQQHQRVYQALEAESFESLHALALKTFTPGQFAAQSGASTSGDPSSVAPGSVRIPIIKGPTS